MEKSTKKIPIPRDHPSVPTVHSLSVSKRDSDIRNVIRHSDIKQGYIGKNKLKLKTLKSEIKVMIETLEDPCGPLAFFQYYRDNKHKWADFL